MDLKALKKALDSDLPSLTKEDMIYEILGRDSMLIPLESIKIDLGSSFEKLKLSIKIKNNGKR